MPASNHRFAVIGMGQFGSAIARELSGHGAEVLAIDSSEDKIDLIKDEVAYAVTLDATDAKALKAQGIEEMDAVVVAIGKNFEALLLCTYILLELDCKRLIARASGSAQRRILERMGIAEILSPEDEVGSNVAESLINPHLLTFLQLPDEYEIVEVKVPSKVLGRTLEDVGLREKYQINLVTVMRESDVMKGDHVEKEKHIQGIPGPQTVITEADTMVLFGRVSDIERFLEINS